MEHEEHDVDVLPAGGKYDELDEEHDGDVFQREGSNQDNFLKCNDKGGLVIRKTGNFSEVY